MGVACGVKWSECGDTIAGLEGPDVCADGLDSAGIGVTQDLGVTLAVEVEATGCGSAFALILHQVRGKLDSPLLLVLHGAEGNNMDLHQHLPSSGSRRICRADLKGAAFAVDPSCSVCHCEKSEDEIVVLHSG